MVDKQRSGGLAGWFRSSQPGWHLSVTEQAVSKCSNQKRRVYCYVNYLAGAKQKKSRGVKYAQSWQPETGHFSATRFTHARAVKPANLKKKKQKKKIKMVRSIFMPLQPPSEISHQGYAGDRHCNVSSAASRRDMSASLGLFARKQLTQGR